MKQFVTFFVQDRKTAESRLQVIDMQHSPAFIQVPKDLLSSVPVMIRKYVSMDRDLTNWEIYHFTNWMMNFPRLSELKRKHSKLYVGIWSFDTTQEVVDFANELQRLQKKSGASQLYRKTTLDLEAV